MILVIKYRTGGWCPGHRVVGSWPPSSPFRPVVSRGSPRVSACSYRAYQRGRDTPPLVSVQVASRQMPSWSSSLWSSLSASAPSRPFQKRVSGCDWYARDVSARATRHVIILCSRISETDAWWMNGMCVLVGWRIEIIDTTARDLRLSGRELFGERKEKKNAEEKSRSDREDRLFWKTRILLFARHPGDVFFSNPRELLSLV